VTDDVTMIV